MTLTPARSLPTVASGPAAPDEPADPPPITARERAGRRRAERRGVRAYLRDVGRGVRSTAARRLGDAGMATAEYAIATLAACGFAALLLGLLRSSEVRSLLFGIIRRALAVG
jgi:hypothetical protein